MITYIKEKETGSLLCLEAAEKITYTTSRDNALCDVVNTAISIKDFNMAIISAEKIHYSTTKDATLVKIVSVAVENKDLYGYAVLAASKIHYLTTRTDALIKIIDAAKKEATNRKKEMY